MPGVAESTELELVCTQLKVVLELSETPEVVVLAAEQGSPDVANHAGRSVVYQLGSQSECKLGLACMAQPVAFLATSVASQAVGFSSAASGCIRTSRHMKERASAAVVAAIAVVLVVDLTLVVALLGHILENMEFLVPSLEPVVFADRCPTEYHRGNLICTWDSTVVGAAAGVAAAGVAAAVDHIAEIEITQMAWYP